MFLTAAPMASFIESSIPVGGLGSIDARCDMGTSRNQLKATGAPVLALSTFQTRDLRSFDARLAARKFPKVGRQRRDAIRRQKKGSKIAS